MDSPKSLEVAEKVAVINQWLTSATGMVPLVFGAVNMVRELFRRREAGEISDAEFERDINVIHSGGVTLQQTADQWLEANGYNADGTRKVAP